MVATSIVGGTASVISGGKFANGAMTAAFQAAAMEIGDPLAFGVTGDPIELTAEQTQTLYELLISDLQAIGIETSNYSLQNEYVYEDRHGGLHGRANLKDALAGYASDGGVEWRLGSTSRTGNIVLTRNAFSTRISRVYTSANSWVDVNARAGWSSGAVVALHELGHLELRHHMQLPSFRDDVRNEFLANKHVEQLYPKLLNSVGGE